MPTSRLIRFGLGLFLTLSINSTAQELTISYATQPKITIMSHDNYTVTFYPSGEAVWLGDIPFPPSKDGELDWDAFHEEAKNHHFETNYSEETYKSILRMVIDIISNTSPTNEGKSGPGYTHYVISLWKNPDVSVTFPSIGGNDFPKEVYELDAALKLLNRPSELESLSE
ncbi:Uncharacterised protein [Halioglobus japonicus]|nr:Uncharacterised protein [Halioglobus japonicus]